MAQYLHDRRPYPNIDAVIQAIKDYLGSNATPKPPEPGDYKNLKVALDPTEATLSVGGFVTAQLLVTGTVGDKTYNLTAADLDALGVTLPTSNSVTVSREGLTLTITGRAATRAAETLTFTVGGARGTMKVTVLAAVNASSISFKQRDITVKAGTTLNLWNTSDYLNLVPQGAVDLIWSSSDSAIATVNDRGMLTAVRTSPTPAVITVTTKGSGLTASVNVWVYENDWDIFIDPMRVTLQAGASTAAGQVRYITATPLTSTRKVVWRSLDATGMITVSLNGIITADARATQNANVAVVLVDASTNKDLSSAETTVALIPALGYNLVVSQAVIEQQTAYYPSLLQVRPVAGNTEVPDRFYWESSNPVILFSSGGSSPTQTIDLPSGTMPAIVTTGIGRSTITLRTTKDSVTKAAEDRYIISAPRGVSGMEFYENNSSTAMKDEPDYGRMITMVDETSTRVTAREPGQTGRELSWLMFETDAQRDRASLTSANSLLSYSNGILRATGMGLARIVVTPAFANLPAGWAQTAEDQRGRWYGRGSLPLFVLTDHDTDPDTPDVNVFNPLIDESLSGLLVKDSATGVLSPLNPNDLTLAAAVEEGTRIICDANGVEKTSASDWNPSDVPLVVKTADSSGSNELFVWIQPAPPIINPNVLPEETMTLSRYNSMIALAQSQTPNLPIISYEVVGDYTYDTVESGGTELSGPLLLAAWTQINGGGTERSADTGLNSIVFGRSPNNMLELSNTNLPRKLTFRAEIRYSTNRGFTNKLDPSDTEGKFITIPIPYTATNNPTVYSFTVTADTSFMAYVEIAKGGTLDLVDSPEVRSIASSAGINLANATFTTGNGPENIVLRNNSVVDVIGTGTATVIIVEGGKSMIVTINQYGATVLATGISLTPATHTMADGTTYALNAAVEPADATNRGITWATSDSTIATVSGGVVTAHNPGTVTITATSQANNAFFKTCEITVNKVDVTGIALSLTTLSLIVNGTQQLSVTFTPSNASDQAINWTTSDANVATVMNGLVTAVGGGTATITAASADLDSTAPPATCTVEVVATRSLTLPLPITPITPVTPLTPTTPAVTLREAVLAEDIPALQSAAKTAGIDPGTARYRSATADKLVIDSVGIAVAVAEGQAQVTITSSDGKKTAAAAVPVAKPAAAAPPKDLKLRTSASVGEKMTLALMPYFDVPNAAAELVWTSSNTSVLTVDQNGRVTGVKAGRTATVTATVKGTKLTAKCSVTVRASKGPSAITMSKSALALEVGGAKAKASADLNVRRTPAKTEGGVTWLSSDETVARVDRNGRVTAVGAGTATVTAVSDLSGVTAVCAVTVTPAVTGLTLNAKTLTMKIGSTSALTCTVAPQSAADAVLTYTSSNKSRVTVDAKGNLKALSAGKATITVTAPSGVKATCVVTVTK
jgi:uncharacterized protein YjdB